MKWSTFLLGAISLYGTIKCITLFKKSNAFKFVGFALALFFLLLTQFSILIEGILTQYNLTLYPNMVVEWGHILSLSFLLTALAAFIRSSKPAFARFPKIYTILPILIVFSYYMVVDSYAIKDWLIAIYQGGAILVALLMYSVYTFREKDFSIILSGVILFLITYILYWYIPIVKQEYVWIWKILVSCAIGTVVFGYMGFHKVEHRDSVISP